MKKERDEGADSYKLCAPDRNDNLKKLYKKLYKCLEYNKVCIKWRRSLIFSVISTFTIFIFVYSKIPETKELILFILILYIFYYYMWVNFSETTGYEAENVAKNIIKQIKKFKKDN